MINTIHVLCAGIGLAGLLDGAAQALDSRDPIAVQEARTRSIAEREKNRKPLYAADKFNLDVLPRYEPQRKVAGVIRIAGSDLFGSAQLKKSLEDGFRKFHPDATLKFDLRGPAIAFAGLLLGEADVGPTRRGTWGDLLAFQRVYGYEISQVAGMTGWTVNTPYAILVHKDNPLKGLTMQQLDGIFGAERDGGWAGTTWHPEYARGKEGNIRTWGDLGLTGEWKDKPIGTYGYSLRYMFAPRFSDDVLKGSDKWNENLRQYVSFVGPGGRNFSPDQQLADAIAKDRYGIAYFTHTRGANAQTRLLPIAAKTGDSYVELNLDTVRNRTYPLVDSMFLYFNRKPGTALDPKVKEFLRYVLSREGQAQVVLDTTMLPLTRDFLLEQRRKLD